MPDLFSRLPTELILPILQHLNTNELRSLCLTCRRLRSHGEWALYCHIQMAWTDLRKPPPIPELVRTLVHRPELGFYVESLALIGSNFNYRDIPDNIEEYRHHSHAGGNGKEDGNDLVAAYIEQARKDKKHYSPSPPSYLRRWAQAARDGQMDAFLALLLRLVGVNLERLHVEPNFAKRIALTGHTLRQIAERSTNKSRHFQVLDSVLLRQPPPTEFVDPYLDGGGGGGGGNNMADVLPFFFVPSVEGLSLAVDSSPTGFLSWPPWDYHHSFSYRHLTSSQQQQPSLVAHDNEALILQRPQPQQEHQQWPPEESPWSPDSWAIPEHSKIKHLDLTSSGAVLGQLLRSRCLEATVETLRWEWLYNSFAPSSGGDAQHAFDHSQLEASLLRVRGTLAELTVSARCIHDYGVVDGPEFVGSAEAASFRGLGALRKLTCPVWVLMGTLENAEYGDRAPGLARLRGGLPAGVEELTLTDELFDHDATNWMGRMVVRYLVRWIGNVAGEDSEVAAKVVDWRLRTPKLRKVGVEFDAGNIGNDESTRNEFETGMRKAGIQPLWSVVRGRRRRVVIQER